MLITECHIFPLSWYTYCAYCAFFETYRVFYVKIGAVLKVENCWRGPAPPAIFNFEYRVGTEPSTFQKVFRNFQNYPGTLVPG